MTLAFLQGTHRPSVSDMNKYCLMLQSNEFICSVNKGGQWVVKTVES